MENKCNSCFYALMDKDLEAPCIACTGYSNYVKGTVYMTSHASQPLREAIDDWFKGSNGVTQEDFWTKCMYSDHGGGSTLDDYPELKYDTVNKPKHYMLFDKYQVKLKAKHDKGIEVRDVIEALVLKMYPEVGQFDGMFIADYVQMMQYLMRFMDKNGAEDLKKARWYLDKLIEAYEPADF